jgi:hypothetical protein
MQIPKLYSPAVTRKIGYLYDMPRLFSDRFNKSDSVTQHSATSDKQHITISSLANIWNRLITCKNSSADRNVYYTYMLRQIHVVYIFMHV